MAAWLDTDTSHRRALIDWLEESWAEFFKLSPELQALIDSYRIVPVAETRRLLRLALTGKLAI